MNKNTKKRPEVNGDSNSEDLSSDEELYALCQEDRPDDKTNLEDKPLSGEKNYETGKSKNMKGKKKQQSSPRRSIICTRKNTLFKKNEGNRNTISMPNSHDLSKILNLKKCDSCGMYGALDGWKAMSNCSNCIEIGNHKRLVSDLMFKIDSFVTSKSEEIVTIKNDIKEATNSGLDLANKNSTLFLT